MWKALSDVGEITKIIGTYPAALLYNVFGPKVAKKLIEAQKRRNAAAPEAPPPEPTLGRGFEDVPQGGAPAREGPLGDLTPSGKPHPALRRRAKAALSRQVGARGRRDRTVAAGHPAAPRRADPAGRREAAG